MEPQTHSGFDVSKRHSTCGSPPQLRSSSRGGVFDGAGQLPDDDSSDRETKERREIVVRRRKDTLKNSDYVRNSKFVARRIPRCEIKKLERGKYILIEH